MSKYLGRVCLVVAHGSAAHQPSSIPMEALVDPQTMISAGFALHRALIRTDFEFKFADITCRSHVLGNVK